MKIKLPNLATKPALNTKVTEIENRIPDTTVFITIPEFERFVKIIFDARMKEAAKSLATNGDITNALNLKEENRRITKRLDAYDSGYFIGKSYFGDVELQNCKVFQPDFKYFTTSTWVIKFHYGKLRGCQKKTLNHLINQTIALIQK